VSVAESLPGPLGSELLSAAQSAFTQSLETAAIVSVAVSFVLRHVEIGGAEVEAELRPEQSNAPEPA
jgi:hypothetical protein